MKNAQARSGTNTGGCIWSMTIGNCQKKLLIFTVLHSRPRCMQAGPVFVIVIFA